jgi:hypothetical protein
MADAKTIMDASMTEGALQQQVVEIAHAFGWVAAHFRPARTERGWRTPVAADAQNFPDLVLVRQGQLIFAECKSQKGELRKGRMTRKGRWAMGQQEWLDLLASTGSRTYVWRPSDLDDIIEILRHTG